MSACRSCLPLDCNSLVDDDYKLYSLQRTLFPVVIECPPGSTCGNATQFQIKCCETVLAVQFTAGATLPQKLAIIQRIVNQCALINAGCSNGGDDDTFPEIPKGPPPPPPPDIPITIELFYNRAVVRTYGCPGGAIYTVTIPAGTVAAGTQALADAQATALANEAVSGASRFCPGVNPIPDFLCVGTFASIPFAVTGGIGPFTWAVQSGTLPTGMSLSGSTGRAVALRGTPTATGTFNFTLRVSDAHGGVLRFIAEVDVQEVTATTSTTPDSGAADGTATATPTGTAPFTYLWSNAQTTQTAVGLTGGTSPVGDYTVTVTDDDGCEVTKDVHVALAGCSPVTDASIYTIGASDPFAGFWAITGGTVNQTATEVTATGSITEILINVGGSGLDGVWNLAPIASCLTSFNSDSSYWPVSYDQTTLGGPLPNLTFLGITNNAYITGFTAGNATPALQTLALQTNDNLAFVDATGLSELLYLEASQPNATLLLTSLVITGCSKMNHLSVQTAALDQASVDNALVWLDSTGVINGIVNLSGGTSPTPSGAGATAATNLIGKGWTVTTN